MRMRTALISSLLKLLLAVDYYAEATASTPALPTSLEIMFTQAYQRAVGAGDWHTIFGSIGGGVDGDDIHKDSFCTGGDPDEWTIPGGTIAKGSDLEAVVQRGIFRCGVVQNADFTSSSGQVLIQSGSSATATDPPVVTGAIVDWFDTVAGYAGDALGTDIDIEWALYESSQATLDALKAGDIDSACGYWSPDGVWTDSVTGNDVARGAVFSLQWCPTLIQQGYIYTAGAASESITTFNALVGSIVSEIQNDPNAVITICAPALPDAGLVTTCQNTFNDYAKTSSKNVVCEGVGSSETAFSMLSNGDCMAVYSGHPGSGGDGSLYNKFPQPSVFPAVSFFRQKDLNNNDDNNMPTSLQLAVTRAFDDLVAMGTNADVFGNLADRYEATSFCMGNGAWPVPKSSSSSDLAKLLDRQVFRCGFTANSYFATSDGQVLIDTFVNENKTFVSGAFPDYWDELLKQVGSYYEKDLYVEWHLYDTSQEILDDLNLGEIDSACAYFSPDAVYDDPVTNTRVPRGLAFSKLYCPVFAEKGFVYTSTSSATMNNINSFDDLVTMITNTGSDEIPPIICAAGAGAVSTCMNTFALYASSQVMCFPVDSNQAFAWLEGGSCDVLFAGSSPALNTSSVNVFEQPYVITPVSLFRTFDIGSDGPPHSSQQIDGGQGVSESEQDGGQQGGGQEDGSQQENATTTASSSFIGRTTGSVFKAILLSLAFLLIAADSLF